MANAAGYERGEVDGVELGSLEDLRRIASLQPNQPTMPLRDMREFLDSNKVVESIAWAIRLNPSAENPRMHPDTGITVGPLSGPAVMRHFSGHLFEGKEGYDETSPAGPHVRILGNRQNSLERDGPSGLFDYAYSLRLPIVAFGGAFGSDRDDFRLDREGPISASYTTPHPPDFTYDSEQHGAVDPNKFFGILHEVSLELIATIESAERGARAMEAVAQHASAIILGTGTLSA